MQNKSSDQLKLILKESASIDIKKDVSDIKEIELRHRYKIPGGSPGVRSVNVSDDNRFLIITYERKNFIRILDLEKLEFLPHKFDAHLETVRLTSISRDNRHFYSASWDGTARKFDLNSGKCLKVFSGFGRSPSCFLGPNEKYLFTASYDSDFEMNSKNVGRCWDLATGEIVNLYKHTHPRLHPESIDIAYDGKYVYTGSDDGIAYQWTLKGRKPKLKYFKFEGSVRKIAVSKNYIASGCTDGIIRVYYKLTGEHYMDILHSESEVRDVRISKDETRIFSGSEDGSVKICSLLSGKQLFYKEIHLNWIWSICLMRDDKILVTGSSDGSVAFYSTETGKILAHLVNLHKGNDVLITCPPNEVFKTGFFYTNNTDYIQVASFDSERNVNEVLNTNDSRRLEYINKLNLKNLIITRLRDPKQYDTLANNYHENRKKLNFAEKGSQILLLQKKNSKYVNNDFKI
jgi:WD40 repeat protein